MKHIFLYVSANKKFVLLYFKQLQLKLRKGPVEKSSSLKIKLKFLSLYCMRSLLLLLDLCLEGIKNSRKTKRLKKKLCK